VCQIPSVPSAAAASGSSHPAAVEKVSVAVLAYVDVQLDDAGTPVAVRTNTGNAPDCEASWYVFEPQYPSGVVLEGTGLMDRVLAAVTATAALPGPGKWQPGTWYQVQAHGESTNVHPADT
jgi:hypothetical protein